MLVRICIGSSCHLKGSERLVHLFQEELARRQLEDTVTLAGSFCAGKCNREGVTVTVDEKMYTGVTPEKFPEFFDKEIASRIP